MPGCRRGRAGHHLHVVLAACSLAAPLALPAETPAARAPITHEKLWMMKRVGAPAVSPDGATQGENPPSLSAIWSPDGGEIVIVATTERWNAAFAHVGYQLYRLRAEGGAEPEPVSHAPGNYTDTSFAPDGHSLLFKYTPQDEEIYQQPHLERVAWPAGAEPTLVHGGEQRGPTRR